MRRVIFAFGGSSARAGKRYSIAPSYEGVISCYFKPPHPHQSFVAKHYMATPRLTNLKTCVCVLINFTYKSVKYFNFLGSGAVRIFDGFVYDYFFDESVKHLSG